MAIKLRKVMIVLSTTILLSQIIFVPVESIYAETIVEVVEEQEQVEEPFVKSDISEHDVLGGASSVPESERKNKPVFSFTETESEGNVGEIIFVTIVSSEEVQEVSIHLPEEATIVKENLPVGLTVEKLGDEGNYLVESDETTTTLELPITFEEEGTYEIFVEDSRSILRIENLEENLIVDEGKEEFSSTFSSNLVMNSNLNFTPQFSTEIANWEIIESSNPLGSFVRDVKLVPTGHVYQTMLSVPSFSLFRSTSTFTNVVRQSAGNDKMLIFSQTISTIPGTNYNISFNAGDPSMQGNIPLVVAAYNGVGVITGTGELLLNNVYLSQGLEGKGPFSFTASGNQTTISFRFNSSSTNIGAVSVAVEEFNLSMTANPVNGGNPSASTNRLASKNSTTINANPNSNHNFVRWEIVSGTGSSIANINSANTTFTMGTSDTEIRAIYERKRGGAVTVQHIDESDNRVLAQEVLNGLVDEEYQTKPKVIAGYTLVKTPANASGKFKVEGQTVTYVYRKNVEKFKLSMTANPVNGGNPSANTTELTSRESTTINANPHSSYNFVRWEIVSGSGSSIANMTSANTTFTMGTSNTAIRAVYERKQGGAVTVQHIDEADNTVLAQEVLNGLVDEEYQTKSKEILGYTLITTPTNASGKFKVEAQTVTYVYKKEKVPPVDPVDPLDPDTEVDPENKPELPEEQGRLSIDFVSQFDFGKQHISAQDQTYYARPQRLLNEDGTVNENEERPNYLQVSDRRAENERNGWQLSVRQNSQFENEAGHELMGASLALSNHQLVSSHGGNMPGLFPNNTSTLTPGASRVLVRAEGDEGTGTWIYRFGDEETAQESVSLSVPKGATPHAGNYSTKLTWQLSMVPLN